ncbi:Uncharacterized conserved protein YndB, AHSA1/START domain [Paraburkholderia fungorum]|uniref:Uncharacterized conserved protein YndB, AHSA1/START domain n=2 Tax=Paraburkholderia fungorum TaxID=134537 RepID=A0A1H1B2H9_9BURK|nr:Uncharacterized conserved protein YndB, AHSA1/START domain [Paraburkholderia fungorum]
MSTRSAQPAHAVQPSLTLRRRLDATPARIFRAWTEPAQFMTWMHPGGSDVIRAEFDVRVGGHYTIVFRKQDGGEVEVRGTYLEVVPEHKLVFTWTPRGGAEHESQVTILLEPEGGATWLTLTHERFADEAQREDHRHGWTDGIDSLERYVL